MENKRSINYPINDNKILIIAIVLSLAAFFLVATIINFRIAFLIVVGFAVFAFFYLVPQSIFPVLVVITLIDILLPGNFGVPNLLLRELLTPLMLFVYVIKRGKKAIVQLFNEPIPVFGILFCFVMIISFIRNPVSASNISGGFSTEGGIRHYYTFFVGFCTLLLGFWLAQENTVLSSKSVKVLIFSTFFMMVIGFFLAIFKQNLNISFLPDTLYWGQVNIGSSGQLIYRIGFLATFSLFFTVCSLIYCSKTMNQKILRLGGILVGVLGVVISGGRSALIGLLLVIFIFEMERHPNSKRDAINLIIVIGIAVLATLVLIPGQIERMLTLFNTENLLDPGRSELFKVYVAGIKEWPFWGQGIGAKFDILNYLPLNYNLNQFLRDQIFMGGHSTFLSLMFIFGLIGSIPWFGIFIFSLVHGFRSQSVWYGKNYPHYFWSQVSFSYLIYSITTYTVGGNGLTDTMFFLFSGLISGLYARSKIISGKK